ncbi:MarR family transcriptional regulator [Nonomuraea antimicrobica]
MTAAFERPPMRKDKETRFRVFCELLEQEGNIPALAARLRVTERTIQRYLVDLEGRSRRTTRYDEFMPQVLEHLQHYPRLLFTSTELARVLHIRYGNDLKYGDEYDGSALNATLRRMEREGLVRAVPGLRDDSDLLPITRWGLAGAGDTCWRTAM